MREAVHDDAVGLDATRLHVADVVYDENALPTQLEAVRAFEQLGTEAGRGLRQETLRVAIVATEDAGE